MAAAGTLPESPMKIKSYYSRTVEDAIAAARHEMGPEAMLMNSRKTPPEVRHLGEYEVVFADAAAGAAPAENSPKLAGEPAVVTVAPLNDRLSMEVAELKKELEGMRRALTRTAYARAAGRGCAAGAGRRAGAPARPPPPRPPDAPRRGRTARPSSGHSRRKFAA